MPNEPSECQSCFEIVSARDVDSSVTRVVKGRRNCSNDDASEDEYLTKCPHCGALESFKVLDADPEGQETP